MARVTGAAYMPNIIVLGNCLHGQFLHLRQLFPSSLCFIYMYSKIKLIFRSKGAKQMEFGCLV